MVYPAVEKSTSIPEHDIEVDVTLLEDWSSDLGLHRSRILNNVCNVIQGKVSRVIEGKFGLHVRYFIEVFVVGSHTMRLAYKKTVTHCVTVLETAQQCAA